MPVHLYGQPFDIDFHSRSAKSINFRSWRTPRNRTQNTRVRSSARSVVYPGKNLGAAGEGGALVTNNAEFAKRARSLREHGSTVRYYHDEVGFNYRMEGIQGAVLGVKLPHLQKWTDERRRVAHRYHELLKDTPLQLPLEAPYAESAYHLCDSAIRSG